jgi:1-acyl-sn-glycerol-3-phosphate acyltransferase
MLPQTPFTQTPFSQTPLLISQRSLALLQTQITVESSEQLLQEGPLLFVSNHRSFMDPLLLMVASQRSIRFACHHYMQQVPGLRQMIQQLECIPLDAGAGQKGFLQRAEAALQQGDPVGIFPEGGSAMVTPPPFYRVSEFHRGFAHLALRTKVPGLKIVPVALLALRERRLPALPLKWFSQFAPSEPLFNREGWHPILVYQQAIVLVGQPWVVTDSHRQDYQQQGGRQLVQDLTAHCHTEVQRLLQRGYWG